MLDQASGRARLARGLAASDVVFACALFTTVVRGYTRVFVLRQYGLDDYLILFSMVIGIVTVPFHHIMIKAMQPWAGYVMKRSLGEENANTIFTTEFITGLLYTLQIAVLKLSFLAFYHRLLQVRAYRFFLYVTAAFVIAFAIATSFATIFQCEKVSEAFTLHYAGSGLGQSCKVDLLRLQLAVGIFNFLTDLIILLLPIRIVLALNTTKKRKGALLIVFMVGAVGAFATAFRIGVIAKLQRAGISVGNIPDWILGIADIVMLSMIEVNLGTMCANFPAMAGLWNTLRQRRKTSRASSRPSNRAGYDLERGGRRPVKTEASAAAAAAAAAADVMGKQAGCEPAASTSQEHLFTPAPPEPIYPPPPPPAAMRPTRELKRYPSDAMSEKQEIDP